MDRWASLISPGPARGTTVTAIGVDASPLPGREFAVVWCWRLADERYHVELAGVGADGYAGRAGPSAGAGGAAHPDT